MNSRVFISRVRDESGAVMVEFAIVVALFFLLFFSMLDFGRLMFTVVHAEKAAQIAARMATTRDPVCPGVPDINMRPSSGSGSLVRAGTSCDAAEGICASVSFSCGTAYGSALPIGDTTKEGRVVEEIWERIEDLMPPGATRDVLNFRYDFDPALGYVTGPYTPIVTVEFDLADFEFIAPIGGLVGMAAGRQGSNFEGISFPSFSVSLPAEDLKTGPSN